MSTFTDTQLVKGLRDQNDRVISYIYDNIGPKVQSFIIHNGGTALEAEDIFQEGILATYMNIRQEKYQLSSKAKFSTYLIQICKYKWYEILKSARKKKGSQPLNNDIELEEANMQEIMETDEKYAQLHQLIDKLGGRCKDILMRYYWKKESLSEIAIALDMETASVKNGKYRCMQELKKKAMENIYLTE